MTEQEEKELFERIRKNNPDYEIGDEVAIFINKQVAFDGYLVGFTDKSGRYIDEPGSILKDAKSVEVAVKNMMKEKGGADYICIKDIPIRNFMGLPGRKPLLDEKKLNEIVNVLNNIRPKKY